MLLSTRLWIPSSGSGAPRLQPLPPIGRGRTLETEMREIAGDVSRWIAGGESEIAVATVIRTHGSAPRKEGAKLAFRPGGDVSGSISGGCVEASIIETAAEIVRERRSKIVHFDTSDDDAWEVGLPCGGSIDVLVEPIDFEVFGLVHRLIEENAGYVSVTVLPRQGSGPKAGTLIIADPGAQAGALPVRLRPAALAAARAAKATGVVSIGEGVDAFVEVVRPMPTLVLVGGVHIAVALARMAEVLGYRCVVVDPRRTFGTSERFPGVDRLIVEWPEQAFAELPLTRDTAVVVLTHDPKLDDPALVAALRSEVFYVGALGSGRTQEKRALRLAAHGFAGEDVGRIHGPVGLDLGGSTPEEIALAILAEVLAARNGRDSSIRQLRAPASLPPSVR